MADFKVNPLPSTSDALEFELSFEGRTKLFAVSGCAVRVSSEEDLKSEIDYQTMRAVKRIQKEIALDNGAHA